MDGRAPGVYIEFVEPPPAIEPTRVDIPGLVCVTERGPVNTPVRVGSQADFTAVFGRFVPNGLGAFAAKAFFDGGGGPAWVVRVAAPYRSTMTTGPQPADRMTSVVGDLSGLVPGAAATLTQATLSRTYLVTLTDPAPVSVGWDRPLHPDFDLTLPIEIASGSGTSQAGLPDAAGGPALQAGAATPGAWGNRVELVAGPGDRTTTSTRPGVPSGTLVSPVVSTAGFRVGEACRLSQQLGGVTVTAEQVVASVDPGRRLLTWDAPLPGGLDLTLPFTIEATTFALAVLVDGAPVEVWPDLAAVSAHPRFAPMVLQASRFVRVEVVGGQPAPGRVRLAGGRDGTAALTTADLLGDELLGDGVGLAALRDVEEPGVMLIPDLVAPPSPARVLAPAPAADPCDPCAELAAVAPSAVEAVVIEAGASFAEDDIVAAQQLLIESCHRNTERICLLDPPDPRASLAALRAWAVRFSSDYAITIAPWLGVVDPDDSGRLRSIPASGHLAGLISRCDQESGPWQSPANRSLPWAHRLSIEFGADAHALANDAGLNLIRALPGRGLVPLGARTLAADDSWRFVAVRRTMIYLRRTLRQHLAWVPFEPNNAALAGLVTTAIGTLLTGVWEAGGLAGGTAEEAFALAVDPSQASAGQLLILIGVALSRPAEFVLAQVTRTGNRLEITEAPTLVDAGGAR